MSKCTVCDVYEEVIHQHHSIPQCFGGKDSKLVDLCGTCHNLVHVHANALLAFQRSGGKSKVKRFWSSPEKESRALPLVQLIVDAANAYEDNNLEKTFKMIAEFDAETYSKLRFLKKDLGIASLEEALKYCVNTVYNSVSTVNNNNTGKNNEKKRIPLW